MSAPQKRAIAVVDLGFGDAGKGTLIDALARTMPDPLVVRFNGGPQAGHNVVTDDGRHHTFSQFGSGSFVPGVRTLLSRFMLIEPFAMLNEAAHLSKIGVADVLQRTLIDRRCIVVTPSHIAANRIREFARGGLAHGTCGMGVGEAVADDLAHPELTIHASELKQPDVLKRKLSALTDLKRSSLVAELRQCCGEIALAEEFRVFDDAGWINHAIEQYAAITRNIRLMDSEDLATIFTEPATLLFEGAQGVLLDELAGFHPHTTWSQTTFTNADSLLKDAGYADELIRIGVTRTYSTRHGAGPFVAESEDLPATLPEPHNRSTGWQGRFRVGLLDLVMLRYALAVLGHVDHLAVTHVDCLPRLPNHWINTYQMDNPSPQDADLFDLSGDVVRAIRWQGIGSLDHQAHLARRLTTCKPIFHDAPGTDATIWLRQLENEMETPLAVISTGPTATDKQMRASLR